MHQTSNMNDGYLGSGRRLTASVKKHGRNNHIRTILHTLNSRDEMIAKEIEIVTENLLKDPLCFNMKVGGYGGSDSCSEETKNKIKASRAIWLENNEQHKHTEEHKEAVRQRNLARGGHSEETKKRISEARKGKPSHAKGRKVIIKDGKRKYLYAYEELPQGWEYLAKK